MKRIIIPLVTCSLLISSCKKYEDGPCLSFRSKEKRLEGVWLLKYWTVNGIDSLAYWNNYFGNECTFTFNPCQGNVCVYSINWGTDFNYYKVSGTYGRFIENYLGPILFVQDTASSAFPLRFMHDPLPDGPAYLWTISRLKYTEVWFQMSVHDNNYELHLENIQKI